MEPARAGLGLGALELGIVLVQVAVVQDLVPFDGQRRLRRRQMRLDLPPQELVALGFEANELKAPDAAGQSRRLGAFSAVAWAPVSAVVVLAAFKITRTAARISSGRGPVQETGPTLPRRLADAFRPACPRAVVTIYFLLGWPMLRIRHPAVCGPGTPCAPFFDEHASLLVVAIRNAWADLTFNGAALAVGVAGSVLVAWLVVAATLAYFAYLA